MNRIEVLRKAKVTPVVIFDGGKLKAKKGIEKGRDRNRERAKEEAYEALRCGDQKLANRKFSEACDITP